MRETLSISVGSESVAMTVTGLLSCHKETVRFFDWHVLLSPLLEPLLHEWLQLWGKPFTVRSQCATAVKPVSVQIKKEIYTGEVVVEEEVSVSVVRIFGKCFYHFCPQSSFSCASLFPSIYLESRYIPIGSFCSRPHLDSSSHWLQRHVLLQGGPSLEGNHRRSYQL